MSRGYVAKCKFTNQTLFYITLILLFFRGSSFDPSWFTLESSRGIETPGSKLFMRFSVVVLDVLVYVPALYTFVHAWQGTRSSRKRVRWSIAFHLNSEFNMIL